MALYRARLADQSLLPDPEQNLVVEKLTLLAQRLQRKEQKPKGFASAIFGWGREPVRQETLKGLYIYGSVGRGKSVLMQIFVEAMGQAAWRVHFHEFMQGVQNELTQIRQAKSSDPLDQIAAQIAQKCEVLCLDEMQIENIADAMIVGRLFEGIFARGIVLITTSNRHPGELYKGGLNRHRFTPFINEISTHCEIVSLDGPKDYREAPSSQLTHFFIADQAALEAKWAALPGTEKPQTIKAKSRQWVIEKSKRRAAFLSFEEACETPKGAADYQALADAFEEIYISQIPVLTAEKTSAAQRFITLIDILYEEGRALYLNLEAPLDQIHQDQATAFAFKRTLSRLNELGR